MTAEPKHRSMLWPVLFAAAITAVLAGAAAIAYVIGWGLNDDQPAATSTADVQRQMQCTTIKREHDAWRTDWMDLATLGEVDNETARYRLKNLMGAGDAFGKAATGYDDQPAKELSLAVATYNAAVAFVNVEATVKGSIGLDLHGKALAASREVDAKYEAFLAATCS